MKKVTILILLVVAGVIGVNAQEALAVLKSGNTTKTYAGYAALQNAYADANDGDLITLSSGTFGAVATIEKSITIRGAGAYIDNTYKTQPTYISGDFVIAKNSVQIEGIHHPEGSIITLKANSPKFIKCQLWGLRLFKEVKDGNTVHYTVNNAYFLHCQILNEVNCSTKGSMTFINCQVYRPQTVNSESSSMVFRNCVVYLWHEGDSKRQDWGTNENWGNYTHVYGSTFINCVVNCNTSSTWYSNEYTTFTNCLFYPKIKEVNGKYTTNNCWTNDNWDNIFVKDSWYVFTDTSKGKYLDEYGREIGIRGGSFPWKSRVAGPHIKSMEVAPRSTADGKLRVKMTVETSSY